MRVSLIKHLFIVSTLLCSPLMTSCNNVVVKEPSFSHYENEITFDEWEHPADAFTKLFNDGLFSFSSFVNFSSSVTQTHYRNGKEDTKSKYSSSSSIDRKLQINSGKQIGYRKTDQRTKSDTSASSLSVRSTSSNTNAATYYQIEAIDELNHFVEINKKAKIYHPIHVINEAFSFETGALDLFYQQYEKVVSMDNEITFQYKNNPASIVKYYLDGSIFTCVFELFNNSSTTSLSETETKTERTLQFDFTSKMVARFSEIITKTTSSSDGTTSTKEVTANYFSSTFEKKTPSIRKVNIKKFDRVIGGVE